MSFKSLCVKYFGSDNFYEILGINPDASEKQSMGLFIVIMHCY